MSQSDASGKRRYDHDLVVVSDLHLGEGRRPGSPRWSPTEDFFHDEAFARFLSHLHERYAEDPSRLALVINGDLLDFLTVTRVPDPAEARRRGFRVSSDERKFGLDPSEKKSVFKLEVIVEGHPRFFDELARFVAAGHRVEILRGNHDLELYFPSVRSRLLEVLSEREGGPDPETVRERVRIHQWFYLEPERVFIEHGNQYDTTNSIRYPLRPLFAKRRWWRRDSDGEAGEGDGDKAVLDYPLGSIFVRFFYNRVRRLDPHAPRLLSFDQYMRFIRRYNLFDVWRVLRDHYPHFVSALGSSATTGSSRSSEEADLRQEADFVRLEQEDEGGGIYRRLNELKIHPAAASKPAVVRKMIEPLARRAAWFGLYAFIALTLWLLVFQLIQAIPWFAANVVLMSLFVVVTLAAAGWAWLHLDRKLRRRRQVDVLNCAERAEEVGELLDVPLVLMGHTHTVDHRVSRGGAVTYANSGTWTSVANPWNRLMRDARRLTFLTVEGDEVELKRWNDDACRIDDVPLFFVEEEEEVAPAEESPMAREELDRVLGEGDENEALEPDGEGEHGLAPIEEEHVPPDRDSTVI